MRRIRGEAEKCPNCSYFTLFGKETAPLACRRLYVKHRGGWLRVGWICLHCGYVKIEGPPFTREA